MRGGEPYVRMQVWMSEALQLADEANSVHAGAGQQVPRRRQEGRDKLEVGHDRVGTSAVPALTRLRVVAGRFTETDRQ